MEIFLILLREENLNVHAGIEKVIIFPFGKVSSCWKNMKLYPKTHYLLLSPRALHKYENGKDQHDVGGYEKKYFNRKHLNFNCNLFCSLFLFILKR